MIEFSLYKVARILLPHAKRVERFIAWTMVFVSGLYGILEELNQYWETEDRIAKMTPQVGYLEKYLNDKYNVTTIEIVDGFALGPWVWRDQPPEGEVDFFMLEPDNYVWNDNDVAAIDFVVRVPSSLESECNVIAAIVQYFKLAGKTFIIELI